MIAGSTPQLFHYSNLGSPRAAGWSVRNTSGTWDHGSGTGSDPAKPSSQCRANCREGRSAPPGDELIHEGTVRRNTPAQGPKFGQNHGASAHQKSPGRWRELLFIPLNQT